MCLGVTVGAYVLTRVAMRYTDQVHELLSVSPQCKDSIVDRVVRQHEIFEICSMGGKARTSSEPSSLFTESASSRHDSKSRRPYRKSFMSLMWMKDYTYMVINDGKVP